jgi:hypothetical protein
MEEAYEESKVFKVVKALNMLVFELLSVFSSHEAPRSFIGGSIQGKFETVLLER